MNSSYRSIALRTLIGFALATAVVSLPGIAQARLLEPTYAGPLSNGSFSGLPIRADASAATSRRPAEVVGENCYIVQRQSRSAGRVISYREPVCE